MAATAPAGRDLLWRVVDGETIILDMTTGDHFSLNQVATEIWTLIHEGHPVAEVTRRLAERYRQPLEAVRDDVEELLAELREIRLWSPA